MHSNVETVADLAVGDEAPGFEVPDLSVEDFVKYAGASGDFTRLHYDKEFAQAAGQEDIIAQGMLLAGFGARLVTDWLGHRRVRAFSTQFNAAVTVGETVTVSGEVTDKHEQADEVLVEVEFAVDGDEETALTGTATAAFEPAE